MCSYLQYILKVQHTEFTDVLDIKCEGKRRMINYKKLPFFCTLVYKFFKGKEAATFLSNHFISRYAVGT